MYHCTWVLLQVCFDFILLPEEGFCSVASADLTFSIFPLGLLGAGIMGLCCSCLPLDFVPPVFRVPLVAPSSGTFSSEAPPIPSRLLGLQIGTGVQSQPHCWLGLLSPVLPFQPFPFLAYCFSAWKAQPKVLFRRMKDKDALQLLILLPPLPHTEITSTQYQAWL